MARMMAIAAANAATAAGKVEFACYEHNLASGRGPAPVLPLRLARRRRRVGGPRRTTVAVRASSSGTADENMIPDSRPPGTGGYESCVDASMMVLRRRIEGMRVKETVIQIPNEWMEWEKSSYSTYRADVNILVASLQTMLLGMRPSVVLFVVSFLLAASPVAIFLLFSTLGSQLYTLNSSVLDFLAP